MARTPEQPAGQGRPDEPDLSGLGENQGMAVSPDRKEIVARPRRSPGYRRAHQGDDEGWIQRHREDYWQRLSQEECRERDLLKRLAPDIRHNYMQRRSIDEYCAVEKIRTQMRSRLFEEYGYLLSQYDDDKREAH